MTARPAALREEAVAVAGALRDAEELRRRIRTRYAEEHGH